MEFKMKILMLNETLRKVPSSNQNRMIILMTNEIGGFILFPTLDILMGVLSSILPISSI
jgi:hypothetical protein